MTRARSFIAAVSCAAAIGSSAGTLRAGERVWSDVKGDAVARRTDPGADGVVSPQSVLPDLLSATLSGWDPDEGDPYEGVVNPSVFPNVLRIELRFFGLVNPPGPLEPGMHDPYRFGPSPLYGFLELDVDDNPDTGGEFQSIATSRYLANIGRFGKTPSDGLHERAIIRQFQRDTNFSTPPQFERSGAEFALSMCGCWDVELVSQTGDGDGVFEAGERFVVKGRFFERAQAFHCLGFSFGDPNNGGPSAPGYYDPPVDLRFTHDPIENETIVELIYPLTYPGAAELFGGPIQFFDATFGGGNHFCLIESLIELNLGAAGATGDCDVLAGDWNIKSPVDYINPVAWRATAIFGTTYSVEEPVSRFVWTDTGFGEVFGDFDGDGVSDDTDECLLGEEIDTLDGSALDEDGNGSNNSIDIPAFGTNFSVFDLDYGGIVDEWDEHVLTPCVADIAEPFGVLDFSDVLAYICRFAYTSEAADLAEPFGVLNFDDVLVFLVGFGAGCP